ncbi:MAG: periplasmic sensor hybrid histidine kinase [Comamonadaceae bacterium]|nr:MAG: periplasmic sensor hybrid histidine kinase [Comamonadaceae bacterium]
MDAEFASEERALHVRAASSIGLVVGGLFAVFNLLKPDQLILGLIELAAVLLLVAPAVILSRKPGWVALAETLLLLASGIIFGALIVAGGTRGTGLFWVFTVPFLAFFLKGERLGWVYSLSFLALATVYLMGLQAHLSSVYPHSPEVAIHFLLSLGFYTLVAAAFDHVRRRYEAQLKRAKALAEAAYQSKSRFLAAASHDLRQPAHALGLFVASLKQLPHGAQGSELLHGVDASVRVLQDMLNAFFDYSRLDAPSLQIQSKPFSVNSQFEQLRNNFAVMAAGKGVRLRIRPSKLWLQTDPVLLQRVLLNLVSNALQHTTRGCVLVACRSAKQGQAARIEVWDSGIGIAPEHHDKIFEEFYQVGNQERDRTKGLGLGLSIVKRTCGLLNLNLYMRSSLGQGSRFSVEVPRAVAQQHRPVVAMDDHTGMAELSQKHVLLIEDDALGSLALTGVLQSWGCRVTRVDTALAACEQVRRGPLPDVLVSDLRLRGELSGLDAVRMVRELLGQNVPACMISGDTAVEVREQVQAAGLVLLQKPVRPAKLRSVLRQALRGKSIDALGLDET